jgi:two-component system NtrC family response regulator/two-component system nitrogen regulation response regulator GlnG
MPTPKILIVEDVPQISESLVDVVRMKGWTALSANTGRTGVELALREHPDLILLDMRLPDMNGYEVYDALRADAWGQTAEVLIVTASESTTTIAEHINLPADRILFKPDWSLVKLLEKIESILGISS